MAAVLAPPPYTPAQQCDAPKVHVIAVSAGPCEPVRRVSTWKCALYGLVLAIQVYSAAVALCHMGMSWLEPDSRQRARLFSMMALSSIFLLGDAPPSVIRAQIHVFALASATVDITAAALVAAALRARPGATNGRTVGRLDALNAIAWCFLVGVLLSMDLACGMAAIGVCVIARLLTAQVVSGLGDISGPKARTWLPVYYD